jgi:hypothetical protein
MADIYLGMIGQLVLLLKNNCLIGDREISKN